MKKTFKFNVMQAVLLGSLGVSVSAVAAGTNTNNNGVQKVVSQKNNASNLEIGVKTDKSGTVTLNLPKITRWEIDNSGKNVLGGNKANDVVTAYGLTGIVNNVSWLVKTTDKSGYNNGDVVYVNAGDEVKFDNGTNISAVVTNKVGGDKLNPAADKDTTTIKFNLNENLTGIRSIESKDKTKISLEKDKVNVNKARVSNVADAKDKSDAVNLGQLNGVKDSVTSLDKKVTGVQGSVTTLDKKVTGVQDSVTILDKKVTTNITGIQSNLHSIDQKVNKLDERVRGIGASSAAAAALPQVSLAGKSMLAVSAGGYSGASAVAVGYSGASNDGKVILKLQGTVNSEGHLSGGAGVGYQW
ncbi:MAG: YadA-like family protein [[Pasteurella] mairii]|uniref:Autotransporter adhesin n=1 Tax=[Pasteurella] mairii TaxID=757 RepID=A0A379B663_9PAST|nr:YadA-like family protein [[Pasteurella] mairii]SUB33981.1 autotransporter adhesin [[Pasteurella] mairii]